MDLIATLQVMLRRWYVVVPMLLLSLTAVMLVYVAIQPTYQTTGSVILHGPEQNQDPKTGDRNRYADYGNLGVPAKLIVDALSQNTYREKLRRAGVPGDYLVTVDPQSPAPIIGVVGTAKTPAEAISTTRALMAAVDSELLRRQQKLNAPKITYLTTEVVTSPAEAEPLNGSRLRAAAGLLVVGMMLTLAVGFVTEAIARRRQDAASRVATAPDDQNADDLVDAFECGLCGEVFTPDEVIDHLAYQHGLQTQDRPTAGTGAATGAGMGPGNGTRDHGNGSRDQDPRDVRESIGALVPSQHDLSDRDETQPNLARRLRSANP